MRSGRFKTELRLTIFILPLLILGCKTYHIVQTDVGTIRMEDGAIRDDQDLAKMIAPYQVELGAVMDEVCVIIRL